MIAYLPSCLILPILQFHKEGEHPDGTFPVSINCTAWGERSEYPKDAMDGILLSLKESAENCSLDSLMVVCCFLVKSDEDSCVLNCHKFHFKKKITITEKQNSLEQFFTNSYLYHRKQFEMSHLFLFFVQNVYVDRCRFNCSFPCIFLSNVTV